MLRNFPLLALVLIAFHVLAFVVPTDMTVPLFEARLPSGAVWVLTVGDTLVGVALVLLFIEMIKSTRTTAALWDHLWSMGVFVMMLIEFILIAPFATGAFFLVLLASFIDVVSGFAISLSAARRDFGVVPH